MKEIENLHEQAMDMAESAILLKLKKNAEESFEAFSSAYQLEAEAAMLLKESYDLEPSRAILFRSAASLALNAKRFRDAEKMVALGLAGNPPESLADELRNIYENINFEKHLQLKGIVLSDNDVQLSLAGNSVCYGMIKAEEFIKRAEIFEKMTIRTAEWILKKPFREKGAASKDIKNKFETYYSVPRAASFAITMKVGYPNKQQYLIEEENFQVSVINEILENIKMVNDNEEQQLKEKIDNDDYFLNAMSLIKELSPDNNKISLVGLTASQKGIETTVAFTRPTEKINIAPMIHKADVSALEEIVVTGKLNYANASDNDIKLESTDGQIYTIFVPKGFLADIVKPYWEENVTIKGKRQDKKIFYEDLQFADEVVPSSI